MEEIREKIKDRIKELILKFVKLENGINNVRVMVKIMETLGPMMFTPDEYLAACEELLASEEIFVLEFLAHNLPPSRAKMLLFTKGTTFPNLREIANGQKQAFSKTNMAG